MSFDPATAAIDLAKVAIERIWPDANKRAEELLKLEALRQEGRLAELHSRVQIMLGQMEVNKVEAAHRSLFVAGWRPAVGWVCVSILAFNYMGVYLLEYLSTVTEQIVAPPARQDMSDLWPVLLGMLGISASRSYEKVNGVETNRLGK